MSARPDPVEADLSLAPPIRPWRSLLICVALVALSLALLRDLGITDQRSLSEAVVGLKARTEALLSGEVTPEATPAPDQADPADPATPVVDDPQPESAEPDGTPPPAEQPQIALPEAAEPAQSASGGSLLARVIGDPVRLIFAAACVATLLFIVVQLLSLAIDTRLVRRQKARSGLLTPLAHIVRALAARRLRLGHPDQRRMDALLLATEGDVIADPLRLGLTAYPMLGFLGTVVGLSGAIETLPDAIGNPDALRPVLTELHVAFDTTLIGLVGALICLAGARALDGGWDRLSRHASLV